MWQAAAAEVNGFGYICYPPEIAVSANGEVFIAEPTNAGLQSLTVGAPNGQVGGIEFPPSVVGTTPVQCCVGPPMVNTDGTAYVEYEVRNTSNNVITSDTLYLYNATTASSTVLSSTTQNEALLPGPIIPDGQGGILATWTISPPVVLQFPYQAADVTNGVVGTPYNLPFSPTTVTFGQSPTLVLGQNGVAFATDGTHTDSQNQADGPQVVSFNVSSGTVNWSYQAAAGDTLSLVQATSDGGVTISDGNAGGILQLSSSGGSPASKRRRLEKGMLAASLLPLGAVPLDLSTWISITTGTVTSMWSPDGSNGIPTILAQSGSPMPHGNTHGQNSTPFCQRQNVICALVPSSETGV